MPIARVKVHLDQPKFDVLLDLGHPLLNKVFDGFIKVGGVGAIHGATHDCVKFLLQDETNKASLGKMILKCEFTDTEMAIGCARDWAKQMASRVRKETIEWGLVGGVYCGMTYTLEETRGVHDWKNALFGGALTGATLSLIKPNASCERAILSAITGGAIATAGEVLKNII